MKRHLQTIIILRGALMVRPLCDNATARADFTDDTRDPNLCGACRNRLPFRPSSTEETADCQRIITHTLTER